jgi:hypothetical protein
MKGGMETMVQAFSGTVRRSPEIMTIHTTLYDLIAALSAEVGPDEENVLTGVVVHLLNTQIRTGSPAPGTRGDTG